MHQLLIVTIYGLILGGALLFLLAGSRILSAKNQPQRMVILLIGENCETLEEHLRQECGRARKDQLTTLFLLCEKMEGEAFTIASHFCRMEPNIFCGDREVLRRVIKQDAVYKVVEIVLY